MAKQPTKFEDLPTVTEFTGMFTDPAGDIIVLQYRPAHRPDTICSLRFPLQAAGPLTDWLLVTLEKLMDDVERRRRQQGLAERARKLKPS